jgi:hypothetical protein
MVELGMWCITGTVYFLIDATSLPFFMRLNLSVYWRFDTGLHVFYSWFDIWELEEYGSVWDLLVIEDQSYAPYGWGETLALITS